MMALHLGAGDGIPSIAKDVAITAANGNCFHILLDFELLKSHMPFYQSGLGDQLE